MNPNADIKILVNSNSVAEPKHAYYETRFEILFKLNKTALIISIEDKNTENVHQKI